MQLSEAKNHIRAFIRAHWSDQRCAEVLAFAQDGKMSFMDPCGCIIGVTASRKLHQRKSGCCEDTSHYYSLRMTKEGADVEFAFCLLGGPRGINDQLTMRRFIPILKAEIRLRDRAKAPTYAALATGAVR